MIVKSIRVRIQQIVYSTEPASGPSGYSLFQPVVFPRNHPQPVVRERHHRVALEAGHRFSADHRVDDRLFGLLPRLVWPTSIPFTPVMALRAPGTRQKARPGRGRAASLVQTLPVG